MTSYSLVNTPSTIKFVLNGADRYQIQLRKTFTANSSVNIATFQNPINELEINIGTPMIDNTIYVFPTLNDELTINGLLEDITIYFIIEYYNDKWEQIDSKNGTFIVSSSGGELGAGGGGGGMGDGGGMGGGAGAGSDPYITTFSGYTFELPHLNKWWNLFSHKSSNFFIKAHTHNYSNGNFFNEIIVNYGKSKAIIDYQKKNITSNKDFKVGKTKIAIKYESEGKINEENKNFDYVSFNHPEFKEVKFLINWRNHYFHPIFQVNPTKDCSGLLMMKEPSKTL